MLAIAAAGLIMRVLHVSTLYYSPVGDQTVYPVYGDLLLNSISGQQLSDSDAYLTARNPPGYSILVASVRRFFGPENFKAVYYIQAILDTLSILLIGYIGRVLFGIRAGLLSAFGYAFFDMLILYTAQLQTETVAIFCMVAAIAAFLYSLERPRWWKSILAGVFLALAAHVRLNMIVLLPVFLLYGSWRTYKLSSVSGSRRWLQAVLPGLVLVSTVFVLVLPFSIRNSRILREPVLICGANAERFLLGSNPNSRGNWAGANEPIPAEWQKELEALDSFERNKRAAQFGHDFLYVTHPAYYWLTIVPNKFIGLLFQPHWLYVGQHSGNSMELPFGPRLRIPLLGSIPVVVLGLCGLLITGRRYYGFASVSFAIFFASIQFLLIEARYRLPAEVLLILTASALLDRVYFRRNFPLRFFALLAATAVIAFSWSSLGYVRFSGRNLLADSKVLTASGTLEQMVNSEYVLKRKADDPPAESVYVGEFPVDAGHCSEIAFRFNYKLERPAGREDDYNVWGDAWPQAQLTYSTHKDDGTTTTRDNYLQNTVELDNFNTFGGAQWRVAALPGTTKLVRLWMNARRAGTIRISGLEARGPVWY